MPTIVMYHYVRNLPRTRFPRIKGLLTENFQGQLDYISRHYSVCSLSQLIAAGRGECDLPPNSCVLTFDDGLADHYETVFPRLLDRGFSGAFFPCARPIEDHCVLDVHKIHFVLATRANYTQLMEEIVMYIDGYRSRFDIPPEEELKRQCVLPSRFDPAPVVFVKSVLQWALPLEVRSEIIDRLFRKYVSVDEAGFSAELYMHPSHIRDMASCGMEIGGHGHTHRWLGKLSHADQAQEIDRTVAFLENILGHRPTDWAMCYPFGSYNSETIDIVSKADCALGLTTTVGLADLSRPLELARLDTNDLPIAHSSTV